MGQSNHRVHSVSRVGEIDLTLRQGHIATVEDGSERSTTAIVENTIYHMWSGSGKKRVAVALWKGLKLR